MENWTPPWVAQRHFASERKTSSSVRSVGMIVILEGKLFYFRILCGMRYVLICSVA